MASEHYVAFLFGDFERGNLNHGDRHVQFWKGDCLSGSLNPDDRKRLKRYIKKGINHRLEHFKHYHRRFKLDKIIVDLIDSELHISTTIITLKD